MLFRSYTVKVHIDADGDMVIVQNPTLAPAIEKSDYEPKTPETDASVDADITAKNAKLAPLQTSLRQVAAFLHNADFLRLRVTKPPPDSPTERCCFALAIGCVRENG